MPEHYYADYGQYPDAWPTTMVNEVEDAVARLSKWVPITAIDMATLQQTLLTALQHGVHPAVIQQAIAQAAGILITEGIPEPYDEEAAAPPV